MQAVILAGGVGSRLSVITGGRPKYLVEFGGRPLILHQLEALADHGVGPILCVLGYQADVVRGVIGDRAETLVNERFAETNSLYSLWLAREWIRGPFVLLNSDLLFDPAILEAVTDTPGTVLAYDSTSSRGKEQTKVVLRKHRVADLGKDLPGTATQGESLGLLKFDEEGAREMFAVADQLITAGSEQAWVIEATRAVCAKLPVRGLNMAGRPWAEIDFPYDLDVARKEVWPAIWKGRWRRQVYWRRTRWAAVGAAAVALAVFGWTANMRVGPASVDWESVPVTGATSVHLERRDDHQHWWLVPVGATATGRVTGTAALVEVRLILPDSLAPRHRYVVAVTTDGKASDWEALTATRDTSVTYGDRRIGDRDRLVLNLPPGPHEIGVRLVEGHGSHMLVRIREREKP